MSALTLIRPLLLIAPLGWQLRPRAVVQLLCREAPQEAVEEEHEGPQEEGRRRLGDAARARHDVLLRLHSVPVEPRPKG